MSTAQKRSLWDATIVRRAAVDALVKLHPRTMMRNTVMFVVEIGSVITTIYLVRDLITHSGAFRFDLQITLWLWFTVLFANFAEAMAEGRGKAQADALRQAKSETIANKLLPSGETVPTSSALLRVGDVVRVVAGEMIPGDGDVIEGVASVDESAITGESAPVIREAGGDRSAVTGGTRVLSDMIKVRISSNPSGRRRGAAEDAERDRAEHPARGTDDHLPARGGNAAAVRDVLVCAAIGVRADRAAGLPDPDDDWRIAVGDRNRGNGSSGAAQRAGHVGTRG
jgi:magnesium-transporting ATPase (P-type)